MLIAGPPPLAVRIFQSRGSPLAISFFPSAAGLKRIDKNQFVKKDCSPFPDQTAFPIFSIKNDEDKFRGRGFSSAFFFFLPSFSVNSLSFDTREKYFTRFGPQGKLTLLLQKVDGPLGPPLPIYQNTVDNLPKTLFFVLSFSFSMVFFNDMHVYPVPPTAPSFFFLVAPRISPLKFVGIPLSRPCVSVSVLDLRNNSSIFSSPTPPLLYYYYKDTISNHRLSIDLFSKDKPHDSTRPRGIVCQYNLLWKITPNRDFFPFSEIDPKIADFRTPSADPA